MGIFYRVKQFWWSVTAQPLSQSQLSEIHLVLSEAEFDLFQMYSVSDQNHAYRVLQKLYEAGETHPSLIKAGLLHDIGKIRIQLTVIDRVAATLGAVFMPRQAEKWGKLLNGEPEQPRYGWRTPFVLSEQHAHWGAYLMAEAGSDTLTTTLIQYHQTGVRTSLNGVMEGYATYARLLPILQRVDNLS